MTIAVLSSLAAHGVMLAVLLLWPGLENLAASPTFTLTVDLVEDRSLGSNAPEMPAGPAPEAAASAPTGTGAGASSASAAKGIETPRAPTQVGQDATAAVGDLLRGAEAAHGGAAPGPSTSAGGVFDVADAGGTGAASLEDFIRVQITRRWQINPDAPDAHVSLRISIGPNGSVLAVAPESDGGEDRVYRALAIAARNAALLSSPLQFPRGTFAITGELVVTLNTRDARR